MVIRSHAHRHTLWIFLPWRRSRRFVDYVDFSGDPLAFVDYALPRKVPIERLDGIYHTIKSAIFWLKVLDSLV
ncbi:hypothetical protein IE4771_PB00321 (plasmid) [Rhizobium etli bv. mimosae str. IE4771]|uniref:Uncharacterized protein n=1 Tax=Rhizobium etli bv. mimosae str. IE4771 TaxID=1432050 RepID=A0A060I8M6_RHIET|nr:hypothetical protein [Rhizobium sp. IE4771]AIC30049.1 hypothetical protein IE4771_PB00321 [Rhizobium sp. IE4771]